MFENRMIKTKFGEVEISRIIASWHNKGGTTGPSARRNKYFNEWLEKIGVSEADRRTISNHVGCGKLELETEAEKFIEEWKTENFGF